MRLPASPATDRFAFPLPVRVVFMLAALLASLGLTEPLVERFPSLQPSLGDAHRIAVFGGIFIVALSGVAVLTFLTPPRVTVIVGLALSLLTLCGTLLYRRPMGRAFPVVAISSAILLALSVSGYVRLTSTRKGSA